MQIIQSSLVNKTRPLGVISSLCEPSRLLLTKTSNLLRNQIPLATASKFLFSHEYEPSIKRFIDWDSLAHQDNNDYPLFDVESVDPITPEENSITQLETSTQDKFIRQIRSSTINERSPEVNLQVKSQSKRTNKSPQKPEKKSKPKSQTKKATKSSPKKNVKKLDSEISTPINLKQDSLLAIDEHLHTDNKSEIQTLQGDIVTDKTTSDSDFVNTTFITTVPTSPVEKQSAVFRKFAKEELQVISESQSILANSDLSTDVDAADVTESISPLQKKSQLGDRNLNSVASSPIEFASHNHIEETFNTLNNFAIDEQEVKTEASQTVNVSDIPFSPNSPQKNIETSNKIPNIADNLTTSVSSKLIEKKEVSPSLTPPEKTGESAKINTNFEETVDSKSNLITENTTNNFVPDNYVGNISGSTSHTLPKVDDISALIVPLPDNEQSLVSNLSDTLPSSESSTTVNSSRVVKNHITIQPEINSDRITDESIQLKSNSASVENIPNLFKSFDTNEPLIDSELKPTMAVNTSEEVNIAKIPVDANLLQTVSNSTENQPILAPLISSEIVEPESTGLLNQEKKSSHKTAKTQTDKEQFSNIEAIVSPEIEELGIPGIAPSTTSPEIGDVETTGLLNQRKKSSRKSAETQTDKEQFSITVSPEIEELETTAFAPDTISPEIGEVETTELLNQRKKSSRKSAETQTDKEQFSITVSPEIEELETTAFAPDTISPEIGEVETTELLNQRKKSSRKSAETQTDKEQFSTTVSPEIEELGIPGIAPSNTSPEIGEVETTGLLNQRKKSSRKAAKTQIDQEQFSNIEAIVSPEIEELETTAFAPDTISPEILEPETTGLLNQEKKSSRKAAKTQKDQEQFSNIEAIVSPEIEELGITAFVPDTISPEIGEVETTELLNQENKSSRKSAKTQSDQEQFSNVEAIVSPEIEELGITAFAPDTISPEIGEVETTGLLNQRKKSSRKSAKTQSDQEQFNNVEVIVSPEIEELEITAFAPLTISPEILEPETTGLLNQEKKSSRKAAKTQIDQEQFSNIEAIVSPEIEELGITAIAPLTISPEIGEVETTELLNQEKKSSRKSAKTQTDQEQFSTTVSPEIDELETTAIAPDTISPEIDELETTGLLNQRKKSSRKSAKTQTDKEQFSNIEAIVSPEIEELGIPAIAPLTISPEIGEVETTGLLNQRKKSSRKSAKTQSDKEQFSNVEVIVSPEIDELETTAIAPLTISPEIGDVETTELLNQEKKSSRQDAIRENLPPPKGYAIGGHVTDSRVENQQAIAPSDTVPAMLTPGEFVINTRDAQKNLPLLQHINSGGTPQNVIFPSLETANLQEQEEKTPTKVDSFPDNPLQRKDADTDLSQVSNPLTPSSLGLNRQNLSILNSPQLSTLENKTNDAGESSSQYSSPPMIFRKANPTTDTPSQFSETPSQWSSIEDLLNGNNDEFTNFNFSGVESNWQNPEFSDVSESSETSQVFAKHLTAPRGFAEGGEVTPSDISTEIKPVTETIQNPSLSSEKDDTVDALETLAREIYSRLRQRVEIEQERHGGYLGRIPW